MPETRELIEQRLKSLLERARRIDDHRRRPALADSEEQAAEAETDEVLTGLDESTRQEIARLRAALERLDSGDYGRCVRCGAKIPAARLAAIPEATSCVKCAAGAGG